MARAAFDHGIAAFGEGIRAFDEPPGGKELRPFVPDRDAPK